MKNNLDVLLQNINTRCNNTQFKAVRSVSKSLSLQISQTVLGKSLCTTIDKLLKGCTFSHFIELVKIDELKRVFFELKTVKGNLSVRELKRQTNLSTFERIEERLSLHDENFNKIFEAIEEKEVPQKQLIFYDWQIFDVYLFVTYIVKSAKVLIKLMDKYIVESTLVLFTQRDTFCFGASLKDLCKKLFVCSKLDINSLESVKKLC